MITDAALVAAGLVVLIVSADFLVRGGSSLASRFGLSSLTIGLTVVSFGTSMPELFVSVTSGLRGQADLAVANVLGSNIFNVLVVLGVAAIIYPLPVHNSTVRSEVPFSVTAAVLLGFLANAALFTDRTELLISRADGAILLFFFVLFMLYIYATSRGDGEPGAAAPPQGSVGRSVAFILLGVVGLYFGGQWAVDGAVGLARGWGVSDALIGLTIVAIGTSLPELTASAVAAWRREVDIAVGNVVGSNIFNILWILGLTASLHELPFAAISNTDILMVIAASVMIVLAVATSRTASISRGYGCVFVVLYAAYLAYAIQRA